MRSCLRAAAAAALVMSAAVSGIPAQATGASTLKGRVLDETGSPLPGAVVKLANPAAPVGAPSVVTDLEGHYRFLNLPPGREYTITASIPDYATIIAGPVELRPGKETRLDLTLKRSADLEETVRVEARGEVVETESAATSTTFNSEFIEGVPLVGRGFSDLLTLAPGITDADGDGNVNVRGARDTGLQIRLDGSNVTDPLTGHFGQGVNLEAVEELEIVTAGASAEYGRADGGFANVVTKSGGNETSGSFKLFYRSEFLDGDNSGTTADGQSVEFTDVNYYGTLGGALVKDHLWYFVALESLDEELPVVLPDDETVIKSREGWHNFAKLTWQASPKHKLALQINHDPLESLGNYQGAKIAPETDFRLTTGGSLPQLTWTSIISPQLLMQFVASRFDARADTEPISEDFRMIDVVLLPANGQQNAMRLPCLTTNCVGDHGVRRLYTTYAGTLREPVLDQNEDGAYSVMSDIDLERVTLRSDLSYTLEDLGGQHGIKSGFQYEIEKYREDLLLNPVLTDDTCAFPEPHPSCSVPAAPNLRGGTLTFQVYDPSRRELSAESFNVGIYGQDAWKPLPNLTLNLGLRVDREEVESGGFTFFDPDSEAREVLRRYNMVCDAAGSSCQNQTPGRLNARLPGVFAPPAGHPALQFDADGNGLLDLNNPAEGGQIYAPFTQPSDRVPEAFLIENTNLSPRVSLSWDPWADGRTKLFTSWGRYYDRLFLGSVVNDQKPSSYVARWTLGQTLNTQAPPGRLSSPISNSISVSQTERDLRTPHTVEFTAGIERELAPEWAVSLTYIHRKGEDLLQDMDVNHITCEGFDETFGVDPFDVCGDGGQLEMDRFGDTVTVCQFGVCRAANIPNEAPDLFNLNRNFNQVLRVGNFNSSRYEAWEAVLRKRLHRNWQMQAAYTWSKAQGEAESFSSLSGNDPAVSDKVAGYLAYDQTHIVKFQSVSYLPHDILLGATVQWASGLPYSLVRNVEDFDDVGLLTPQRVFSQTGEKNDQRNHSLLTVDGRIEKRLNLKRYQVSAFLAAENLLDSDELVLREIDRTLGIVVDGEQRLGRRFEMGASILF